MFDMSACEKRELVRCKKEWVGCLTGFGVSGFFFPLSSTVFWFSLISNGKEENITTVCSVKAKAQQWVQKFLPRFTIWTPLKIHSEDLTHSSPHS